MKYIANTLMPPGHLAATNPSKPVALQKTLDLAFVVEQGHPVLAPSDGQVNQLRKVNLLFGGQFVGSGLLESAAGIADRIENSNNGT